MKNLAGLMKQANQMQKKMEELQERLEGLEILGTSGAGMVTLVLNGKGELKTLSINPKMVDPNETEMLQDLIVAAHADARRKTQEIAAEEAKKVTGGLDLPPGMKLPF
jgi:DNA-binding YbaB/EbfC family protein